MKRNFCLSLVALIAAFLSAGSARAGGIFFLGSDYGSGGYIDFANATSFNKEFGGNVKWGNGGGSGDWEYAVVNGSDVPYQQAQQAWPDPSSSHDVRFDFGAGTAALNLSGIGMVSGNVSTSGPNTLLVRVRDNTSPFTELSNLQLNVSSSGASYSLASLTGDSNAEYWGIFDEDLAGGFSLTANAFFAGPRNAGSIPMYQFKVGTVDVPPSGLLEVPEPASLAVFGLGMCGLAFAGRRRKSR